MDCALRFRTAAWRLGAGAVWIAWAAMLPLTGCHRSAPPARSAAPPSVPVSQPVQKEVTDFVDYTGRTDAIQSVSIRARVTGYLVKMPFKEGAEVKTGDLLFEIDPRPYQALVDQAEAQLALNQAQLTLGEVNLKRDLAANEKLKGTITLQQIDQDKAALEQAKAGVQSAQAVLDSYKLNLSFTEVTSPIDGQVSRYYYTIGNLVTQDQTLLTTVVSVDPMYAYFDMDERTLLRIRKAINEGKIRPRSETNAISVLMGLEGETGFPHEGTIDFVNNTVNPSTGTIAVRGVFENPLPTGGRRLLSPGMFVRIRLPLGRPHEALLISDRAVGSDQGLKFVYVVDAQHKVQYRRVTTGALQPNGLRVVEEGLKPEEWVVIGALQQVRPRMEVQPEETKMPTFDARDAGEAGSSTKDNPQPPPPGENAPQQKTPAERP